MACRQNFYNYSVLAFNGVPPELHFRVLQCRVVSIFRHDRSFGTNWWIVLEQTSVRFRNIPCAVSVSRRRRCAVRIRVTTRQRRSSRTCLTTGRRMPPGSRTSWSSWPPPPSWSAWPSLFGTSWFYAQLCRNETALRRHRCRRCYGTLPPRLQDSWTLFLWTFFQSCPVKMCNSCWSRGVDRAVCHLFWPQNCTCFVWENSLFSFCSAALYYCREIALGLEENVSLLRNQIAMVRTCNRFVGHACRPFLTCMFWDLF